jgi:hypothetical protein
MAGDARLALIEDPAQLEHRKLFDGQQRENAQSRAFARRAQYVDNLFAR